MTRQRASAAGTEEGGVEQQRRQRRRLCSPRSNNTRQATRQTDTQWRTPPAPPPDSSSPLQACGLAPPLVVVAHGQHQRDEAAQHQGADLQPAQSFAAAAAAACGRTVAVAAAHLGQDVHGGHVEEGAGGEEHGHAGGVDVRERLLAALEGGAETGKPVFDLLV